MKTTISVDIYGKCSKEFTSKIPPYSQEEKMILSKYKFYLAFENSKCPEYVTEKLYRIINANSDENPPVPIVMGPNRTWYEKNLPPQSYIHVDDFNSPEELGSYLEDLDSHDSKYLKYLHWRRFHKLSCHQQKGCQLCSMLLKNRYNSDSGGLNKTKKELVIPDFQSFWKRASCQK